MVNFHLWKTNAGNEIHTLSVVNLDLFHPLLSLVKAPQALEKAKTSQTRSSGCV